jgi:hypothetical protein
VYRRFESYRPSHPFSGKISIVFCSTNSSFAPGVNLWVTAFATPGLPMSSVMANMFGDILSELAVRLVGGMGMAACGEIGDQVGLFQPAHGSAPDIIGQDKANPLAAIG